MITVELIKLVERIDGISEQRQLPPRPLLDPTMHRSAEARCRRRSTGHGPYMGPVELPSASPEGHQRRDRQRSRRRGGQCGGHGSSQFKPHLSSAMCGVGRPGPLGFHHSGPPAHGVEAWIFHARSVAKGFVHEISLACHQVVELRWPLRLFHACVTVRGAEYQRMAGPGHGDVQQSHFLITLGRLGALPSFVRLGRGPRWCGHPFVVFAQPQRQPVGLSHCVLIAAGVGKHV